MTKHRPIALSLTPLESRDAPATLLAGRKAVTFRDTDNDTVTVALSKALPASLDPNSVFRFATGSVNASNSEAQALQKIDLTVMGASAKGVSVTVSALKPDGKTKSTADVGFIDATDINIGSVTVSGDLGRILAGNTTGMGALSVGSMGVRGLTSQAAGGDLKSLVKGAVAKVEVKGDFSGASLLAYSIPTVIVGGSVTAGESTADGAGSITSNGRIGSLKIGGNLSGGTGANGGRVFADSLGPTKIAGDVVGSGPGSGGLSATTISSVVIGGDVRAGVGVGSGTINGYTISSLRVGGSLVGGEGSSSGIVIFNKLGSVVIGKDVVGGAGVSSGTIQAQGRTEKVFRTRREVDQYGYVTLHDYLFDYRLVGGSIGQVTVGGSVLGGGGKQSGSIGSTLGSVGPVKIAGDLKGAAGEESGAVFAKSVTKTIPNLADGAVVKTAILGGNVGAVTVGGTMTGGNGLRSGSVTAMSGSVGAVKISGDMSAGTGEQSGSVIAFGVSQPVISLVAFRDPYFGVSVLPQLTTYRQVGGTLTSVTVGGAVTGGVGRQSGAIGSTLGNAGPVKISGDLTGGGGEESGAVFAKSKMETLASENMYLPNRVLIFGGNVGAVTVGGSVTGKSGLASGSVTADKGSVASVKIGGNLTGGDGNRSGAILARGTAVELASTFRLVGGGIGSVTIGGSVLGGGGTQSGAIGSTLGSVGTVKVTGKTQKINGVSTRIGGNITGGVGAESGAIFAKGSEEFTNAAFPVTVVLGGTVAAVDVAGVVAGGGGYNSASVLADRSVGVITVGGNWTAANIVVGKTAGPDGVIDTDDDLPALPSLPDTALRIGSVSIKGQVAGTADANDRFRVTAALVGSLSVGGARLPLTKNRDTIALGSQGDFSLVEYAFAAEA